jgi:hypothetical protein
VRESIASTMRRPWPTPVELANLRHADRFRRQASFTAVPVSFISLAGTAFLYCEEYVCVCVYFNFNLFSVHLIHMGYDPSDMELVNTEIKLQNITHEINKIQSVTTCII